MRYMDSVKYQNNKIKILETANEIALIYVLEEEM